MAHQYSVELEEGDTFGNLDFLTEEPWSNSFAVALQDKTQVFEINSKLLHELNQVRALNLTFKGVQSLGESPKFKRFP